MQKYIKFVLFCFLIANISWFLIEFDRPNWILITFAEMFMLATQKDDMKKSKYEKNTIYLTDSHTIFQLPKVDERRGINDSKTAL